MSKRPNIQELKADLAAFLVKWLSGQVTIEDYENPKFIGYNKAIYRVADDERKLVEETSREDVAQILVRASIHLSDNHPGWSSIGSQGHLYLDEAVKIVKRYEAVNSRSGELVVGIGDTPVDGDYSSRDWALSRVPVDFDAIRATENKELERAKLGSALIENSPFIASLQMHLVEVEMFDILACFIARVVTETKPSAEFVYWYGPGRDGKNMLTDFLIKKLGTGSCMSLGYERFCGQWSAYYGRKRFARVDEVPKGNFFTEHLKSITGNAYIDLEQKNVPTVIALNHLILMFTSNNAPSFDGSPAQRGRIRVIESVKRQGADRQPEEIQNELEEVFEDFLTYCILSYEIEDRKIPHNSEDILDELEGMTGSNYADFILNHFDENEEGFIPSEVFRKIMKKHLNSMPSPKKVAEVARGIFDTDEIQWKRRRKNGHRNMRPWGMKGLWLKKSVYGEFNDYSADLKGYYGTEED